MIQRITESIERARHFVVHEMWQVVPKPATATGRGLQVLQFVFMVAENFIRDRLLLRASSLAYFTVLAVIPMIAVAIAVIGAVGVRSEGFAHQIVQLLAAGSPEAQTRILGLVEDVNFGGLGTLGAASLFLTTVWGISNIEGAFNGIWGVTQQRSWGRRFPDYLAVLIVAPLLLMVAISFRASVEIPFVVQRLLELPLFAEFYSAGLAYAPMLVMSLVFTFLYWFLPNTKVRPIPAILGGIIAAFLVTGAQRLYLGMNVGVARYDAVFGGFAALPLLFVWIYLFWSLVLFGAELAFAFQTLSVYRRDIRGRKPSPAERESVGLHIALRIARAFRDRQPVTDADQLAESMNVPVRTIRDVLHHLELAGIVAPRGAVEDERSFQLGRPAEDIAVIDVLTALRGKRERERGDRTVYGVVSRAMADIEQGATKGAENRTLADLLVDLPKDAQDAVTDSAGSAVASRVELEAGS